MGQLMKRQSLYMINSPGMTPVLNANTAHSHRLSQPWLQAWTSIHVAEREVISAFLGRSDAAELCDEDSNGR